MMAETEEKSGTGSLQHFRPSLPGTPKLITNSLAKQRGVDNMYFIARDKKKYGPYTLKQLQEFIVNGNIVPTDMVLEDGQTRWIEVSSIADLFPKRKVVRTCPVCSTQLPRDPTVRVTASAHNWAV